MISSVLIIAFSVVLLGYWFRYTCLLILKTKTSKDYSAAVVQANNLTFPQAHEKLLQENRFKELDALHQSLARDYQLLTYLLEHTAGFQAGGFPVEQRMLALDFKLMQCCYALTRRFSAAPARRALDEMSQILSHFANAMGERAAAASRA